MSSDVQHRIIRLSGAIIVAFLVLIGWQSYWQVYKSDWLLAQQPVNRRVLRAEADTPRGAILDRNNTPLAWSTGGVRHYKDPIATAAVLGYHDLRYGSDRIERQWDAELTGVSQKFSATDLQRILRHEKPRGRDLVLTLDLRLQQAAYRALGSKRGAVVMLNPATGEILALATSPTFDLTKIHDAYGTLSKRTDGVLRNRATQDLYPPGSTMKVVTGAAALMHDVPPATRYTCKGKTSLNGTMITDYHGEVHHAVAMPQALAHSCNYYFASTAVALGQEKFYTTARDFGFNQRWWTRFPDPRVLPVEVATSSLTPDLSRKLYIGEYAQMGFGQGSVVATPLQMAMVAAAIANDGKEMAPYLVAAVRKGGTQTVLTTVRPLSMGYPMDEAHARELAAMMRLVVTSGTASRRVNVPGVSVYGKTGTAQQNGGDDHAWFMGFAEQRRNTASRVAFAVVIERGGTGGTVAAPVARQILQTWKNLSE